jgi:hypothetical protein
MANPIPPQASSRQGTDQAPIATSTTSASSAAFGAQTRQVRLVATVATNVLIGDGSPVATANNMLLAPNFPEYFTVQPGQKVAAILGSGTGTLYVTEMT